MKRLHIIGITSACLFLFFAAHAHCGQDHFQPAKGETKKQALQKAQEEYSANVAEMRGKLPGMKRQLATEKKTGSRQAIVRALGKTEDMQAVSPLIDVLQNGNEDSQVRADAAESLYNLYRPGLVSNKSLDGSERQKIKAALKDSYLKQEGKLKCRLAYNLYQLGEKESTKAGMLACLKKGYWEQFNAFNYSRIVDGVMIAVAFPGEDNIAKVDPAAHDIILEASGTGYPEEIRVKAAEKLLKLGDTQNAFHVAKDIVENGKVYDCRSDAMLLMPKIGTPEAKAVLEDAHNKPELKRFAEQILKWVWGK